MIPNSNIFHQLTSNKHARKQYYWRRHSKDPEPAAPAAPPAPPAPAAPTHQDLLQVGVGGLQPALAVRDHHTRLLQDLSLQRESRSETHMQHPQPRRGSLEQAVQTMFVTVERLYRNAAKSTKDNFQDLH